MRNFRLIIVAIASIAVFGAWRHLSAQAQTPVLPVHLTVRPWTEGAQAEAAFASTAGTTIPMFTYSFKATKDSNTYSGTMVGTSPFVSPLSGTSIGVVIVPLKVTIGSNVFDPTAANSCDSNATTVSRFQNSPLVNTISNLTLNGINVGTTQYVNGFRRAEFWSTIAGSSTYQNTLSFTTAAESSVSTGTNGTTYGSGCSLLGIVSYSWLDSYLTGTLLPSLTKAGVVGPTKFVLFLMKNVVESSVNPPTVSSCCYLGYHGATGSPVQTYAPVEWDTTGAFGTGTSDSSVASHEIAEWMDDPLGTNATPAWGGVGQVSACQTNLEVGDPLTGTLMPAYTLNGKAYHVQELGFFSWYFNKLGTASVGTGGKFSSNGKFAGPSKACPPGGTN